MNKERSLREASACGRCSWWASKTAANFRTCHRRRFSYVPMHRIRCCSRAPLRWYITVESALSRKACVPDGRS